MTKVPILIAILLDSTMSHSYLSSPLLSLQISDIVGYEIKPTETTCLANMLEYGFGKFVDK